MHGALLALPLILPEKPFYICFDALPNPNMIWHSIEGHALQDATILYSSIWKGMPFYALPYHIGVWKGMEGYRYMKGHFIREGHALPNTNRT